jgi:hypothetical protein
VAAIIGIVAIVGWVAFWWALAHGPAAARLAALCGVGSLTFFAYPLWVIYADTSVPWATSAALAVLAITLGIFAYRERTPRHESSVRE